MNYSKLLRFAEKFEKDVKEMNDSEWEEHIKQYIPTDKSPKQEIIDLLKSNEHDLAKLYDMLNQEFSVDDLKEIYKFKTKQMMDANRSDNPFEREAHQREFEIVKERKQWEEKYMRREIEEERREHGVKESVELPPWHDDFAKQEKEY